MDAAGDPVEVSESNQRPARFTIRPDDYHVPYAGTAADGRRFFLSDELFDYGTPDDPGTSFVALFLWKADGTFDEVQVDRVSRPESLPPGQARATPDQGFVKKRLRQLGDYRLEPITVEPFTTEVDGVTFGWVAEKYDGTWSIWVSPGNFIAYYAPWDGLEYDT